jgi:mannosyl-oligosaccharide alpha-1,2-mannosidase
MRIPSIVTATSAFSLLHSVSACHPRLKHAQSQEAALRADAVVQAFRIAWDGYYQYAFPHDQLHPIDNGEDDN